MTVFFDKTRRAWRFDFEYRGQRHARQCVVVEGLSERPAAHRTEAVQCERLARAEAIRAEGARISTPGQMTLAEAFAAFASRHKGKANFANIKGYVRELLGYFGADTPVTAIGDDRIWEYIAWARRQPLMIYVGGPKARKDTDDARLWQPVKDGRTRTDSTINHYLAALRTSLGIAAAARDPATGQSRLPNPPKVPDLKVSKRIPKPVLDRDVRNVITTAPQHVAEATVLTVLMGFRQAEVFSLQRKQFDPQLRGIWLDGDDTKGRRDEFVPASDPAFELLQRLDAQAAERGTDYLITWRRSEKEAWRPIKRPKSAWARIRRELGIDRRWHDLKATFVTAISLKNSAQVTKDLARHQSMATTQLYISIVDEARREGVNSIADRAAVAGIDMTAPLGRTGAVPPKIPTLLAQRNSAKKPGG